MKIFAASINTPTPAFLSAVAALTEAGHFVDLYRHRGGGESLKPYNAALLSVGDYTADDSVEIKLAIARASMELPTCYFLDREPYSGSAEQFWTSALFGETAGAALHRSEMLTAAREHRAKIEAALRRWKTGKLAGIMPAHSNLCGEGTWDPTPFYKVPEIPTAKDRAMITLADDHATSHLGIARSNVCIRYRNGAAPSASLWFPLAVACAKLGTVYCDREYNPTLRFDETKAKALRPHERDRIVDDQFAAVMIGVPKSEASCQQINELFLTQIRSSKPIK